MTEESNSTVELNYWTNQESMTLFSGHPVGCSMWVTSKFLEEHSTYCLFIYKLLCPSASFQLYDFNTCTDHNDSTRGELEA